MSSLSYRPGWIRNTLYTISILNPILPILLGALPSSNRHQTAHYHSGDVFKKGSWTYDFTTPYSSISVYFLFPAYSAICVDYLGIKRARAQSDVATTPGTFANQKYGNFPGSPASRSGVEYLDSVTPLTSDEAREILLGIRHDPKRNDLFIAIAIIVKKFPDLLRGDAALRSMIQFFSDFAPRHILELISEVIVQIFPDELPLILYEFYVDSMLKDVASQWITCSSTLALVSKLQLFCCAPSPAESTVLAEEEEEEMLQESGNVVGAHQSASIQHQLSAYLLSRIASSNATNVPVLSLLAEASSLSDCRQEAIRILSTLTSNSTMSDSVIHLTSRLCEWVALHADISLFHGLLSLQFSSPHLIKLLSQPRLFQAALDFIFTQDKISATSHPVTYNAVFCNRELTASLLPKVCVKYLDDTSAVGARRALRIRVILHWTVNNPNLENPYVALPSFPLSLISLAHLANFPVLSMASFLGISSGSIKGAFFHVEALRYMNQQCTENSPKLPDELSLPIKVLLSVSSAANELAVPVYPETILHILALSLISKRLSASDAFEILEFIAIRALSVSINTDCNNELARSICEAAMQLSLIVEPYSEMSQNIFWKAVSLVTLLCAIWPASLGVFAYKHIGNVSSVIDAILLQQWDLIPVSPSVQSSVLDQHLNVVRPFPEQVIGTLRQSALSYNLYDKIISGDTQFALALVVSESQRPDLLCRWLLPLLVESPVRQQSIPVLIHGRIMLHLGSSTPNFCISRVCRCCSSYAPSSSPTETVALITLFLHVLSDQSPSCRQQARLVLQIALVGASSGDALDFLDHGSIAEFGVPYLRSAAMVETCPVTLSQYISFLGAHNNNVEEFVHFVYSNILQRTHTATCLLNDPACGSTIYDAVLIAIQQYPTASNIPEWLLESVFLLLSSGVAPISFASSALMGVHSVNIQEQHIDMLLDGYAPVELQQKALSIASADQLDRFIRGFGRPKNLVDTAIQRLSLLRPKTEIVAENNINATQDSSEQMTCVESHFVAIQDAEVPRLPVPDTVMASDDKISPATPPVDLAHSSIQLHKGQPLKLLSRVIVPKFFPEFHTVQGNQLVLDKRHSVMLNPQELLYMWYLGQYDDLLERLKTRFYDEDR